MEELRIQAEKLAEERRIAREQALEWTREVQMESDEERERKSKRSSKKVKVEVESGDEGIATPSEPKKRRKGKLKRSGDQGGEENNEQLFSDEEVESKPAKKVCSIGRTDGLRWCVDVLLMHNSGERRSGSFATTKIKRRRVDRGRNNCAFFYSAFGSLTGLILASAKVKNTSPTLTTRKCRSWAVALGDAVSGVLPPCSILISSFPTCRSLLSHPIVYMSCSDRILCSWPTSI